MLAIVEYPLTERVLASGRTEAHAWPPRIVEFAAGRTVAALEARCRELVAADRAQSPSVVEIVRELPDTGFGRSVEFRPVVRVLGGYSRGPVDTAEY